MEVRLVNNPYDGHHHRLYMLARDNERLKFTQVIWRIGDYPKVFYMDLQNLIAFGDLFKNSDIFY